MTYYDRVGIPLQIIFYTILSCFGTIVIFVCVCNRPPVCEVCFNYEVVVFQPRKVTPLHLGSIAIVYRFSGLLFSFLHPTVPQSEAVRLCSPIYICTRSPTSLLAQRSSHLGISRTRHPPASTARLCAPHRVSAYATDECDFEPPLLWHTRPTSRYLSAPGCFTCHGFLCLPCAPPSPSLSFPPNNCILRFLVSCWVDFCRWKDTRAPVIFLPPSYSPSIRSRSTL